MRNCFVPGCDQKYKSTSFKRAMFLAPKNKDLLDKWIEALPKVRTFKSHDKVCHLHFREEDIISTYDHTINGKLYQLERGRPRLKTDAVPSINLPTCDQTISKSKSFKRTVKRDSLKKASTFLTPSSNEDVPTVSLINMEILPNLNDEELDEIINYSEENECVSPTDEIIAQDSEDILTNEEINDIYSFFYENTHKIRLPNSLWGIHRCPQRSAIFFSYMDLERMRCTKIISVTCDGTIKVLVDNQLHYECNIKDGIKTLEMLSDIVTQIDEVQINSEDILECNDNVIDYIEEEFDEIRK